VSARGCTRARNVFRRAVFGLEVHVLNLTLEKAAMKHVALDRIVLMRIRHDSGTLTRKLNACRVTHG
jgi:hypothetical protein